MENLLTSMSFWGMAAVIATSFQLIWEHVRGSIRTETPGKVVQVSQLSQKSLSFLERHYKAATLFTISLLAVFVLNKWVGPGTRPITYLIILTSALSYSISLWLGQWLVAYQNRYPQSLPALLFEGKNPRNVLTLLLGIACVVSLLFYFQLEIAWSTYLVLNFFAAYSLGISSITLLSGILPVAYVPNRLSIPSTASIISADRTDAVIGAVTATALLGLTFLDLPSFQKQFSGLGGILLPLVLAFSGVLLSGASGLFIKRVFGGNFPHTLFAEKLATTLLMIIASYLCVQVFLPEVWVFGTQEYEAIQVFYAAQTGLICGLLISKLIQVYEALEKIILEYLYLKAYQVSLIDKVIHNCLRILSSAVPLFLLIAAFLLAYHWVGLYGLCIAVVAMQANLRTQLSTEVAELEKLILRSQKTFFDNK